MNEIEFEARHQAEWAELHAAVDAYERIVRSLLAA